jgi:hypothetical protein
MARSRQLDQQCSSPDPRNLGAGHKEAAGLVEAVQAGEVEIAAVHDASDAMNVQLDQQCSSLIPGTLARVTKKLPGSWKRYRRAKSR